MAFGVLPGRSHSGERIGIIRSVAEKDSNPAEPHPTVESVLRCLAVTDAAGYEEVSVSLDKLTAETQAAERFEEIKKLIGSSTYITDRYTMLTFRLRDDRGEPLGNYDLMITAGPNYDPNELPEGFFRDRQRNQLDPGRLTYFLNHDHIVKGLSGPALEHKIGLRVVARPNTGLAYYTVAELRSDITGVGELLQGNETSMVEITLRRAVDFAVFRLTDQLQPSEITDQPLLKFLPFGVEEEETRRQRFAMLVERLEGAQDAEERKRARQQLMRFVHGG